MKAQVIEAGFIQARNLSSSFLSLLKSYIESNIFFIFFPALPDQLILLVLLRLRQSYQVVLCLSLEQIA